MPYNVVVNMQICCTVQGKGSVSVLYSCGLTSSERYFSFACVHGGNGTECVDLVCKAFSARNFLLSLSESNFGKGVNQLRVQFKMTVVLFFCISWFVPRCLHRNNPFLFYVHFIFSE